MGSSQGILNETAHRSASDIPRAPLAGRVAWESASLKPDDGIITLPDAARREIDAVVAVLRDNPLALEMLEPDAFRLDACRRLMATVRETLRDGVGFVIIDRLPMDVYSKEDAKAAYWLLSQLVSRPVAQSWDGKLVYDVRDLGKPPGNGVRPDVTNAEQNFHTDNSYNLCAPDYVALLCLRPAKEGGISSIVSFHSVYNEMLRKHPQLIDRLFAPYLFDRNREHAPDAPPVISHPLMQVVDGRLSCRLSHRHVINGYRMAGIELDRLGEDALETLEQTMREARFAREFFFEPGQIQIVDNRRLGHRRTGYVDFTQEDRKRHLVRLWLRQAGRRFYNG
ncbi:TauD/TfdA family dioxygenase [Aquincola sp. S2]|uniref:TauD/TfdA family dioxygenase n=1 Tax=Pseudaquabacterium terrae TaxID=2732868 RepID=A0ABX2ETN0_9BURK|nr:TauD/TfdA family dioxygenase [Aquabacterium terrae]NRF72065.1 TauD/TfdA family dioxygenase [Aquabacterium terrae]